MVAAVVWLKRIMMTADRYIVCYGDVIGHFKKNNLVNQL